MDVILYSFPIIATIIFLGLSYSIYDRNSSYTEIADGHVIKMNSVRSAKIGGVSTFSATIKFFTKDKQVIVFQTDYNSSYTSLNAGDAVEITYAENNPSKAHVNWFFSLWTGFIILGFLGLLSLAISIFIISQF